MVDAVEFVFEHEATGFLKVLVQADLEIPGRFRRRRLLSESFQALLDFRPLRPENLLEIVPAWGCFRHGRIGRVSHGESFPVEVLLLTYFAGKGSPFSIPIRGDKNAAIARSLVSSMFLREWRNCTRRLW